MKNTILAAILAIGTAGAGFAAPAEKERVLIVCAHPDDSIAMCGTMYLMKDLFEIHVVDLTSGQMGLSGKGSKDGTTAARREAEERAASKIVCGQIHMFGYQDGALFATQNACERTADLIRELKPRAIFAMWPIDWHPDHCMAGMVAYKAMRMAKYRCEFYYYEQVYGSKGFVPMHFVDISSVIDIKQRYIRCYECQNKYDVMNHEELEGAKFRGYKGMWKVDFPYGERCLFAECFSPLEGFRTQGERCLFCELPKPGKPIEHDQLWTESPVGKDRVVTLPPGDIVVSATKGLGPEASGKTYRGAADGTTRICGGIPVTGWTNRGDGVWGAKLPVGADGKPVYTETLFVNGRRAQRSRFPERDFFRIVSATQYVCAASVTTNRIALTLKETDEAIRLLQAVPADELPHVQLVAHILWDVGRYPIAAITPREIMVDGHVMHSWAKWGSGNGYSLENVRSAFRHPGQWFCDVNKGEVLYRPLAGETIREAVVPRDGLETLLAVRGAHDVTFENVTFAYTSPVETKGPTRLQPYQAAALITKAAVLVDQSTNVVFRNCRFTHVGSYAVWFREGCRGGSLSACEMTDLGAGGVRIGSHRSLGCKGLRERPPNCTSDVPVVETAPWMTSHVTVEDCLIAHGGRFHPAGVGILLAHASDCSVVHNDIYDLYYTGISVGWVWGYSGSPAQRNTIAFNHIRDIGQRQLADMGGVYLLGTAFGTCVSNNVIHDIHSFSYGGWGLYPDEGSEGLVLENNLVYKTDDSSFHQHYGKDNVLRNNILIDSRKGQIAVTRAEPHRSMTVERNIVLWTEGDAFNNYGGTKSEKTKIDWRRNLWWRTDGKDVFNGTTFAAWQGRVGDVGSVFADPGFLDWKGGDYRLKPDSPAFGLGFQRFDPTQAGRRKGR